MLLLTIVGPHLLKPTGGLSHNTVREEEGRERKRGGETLIIFIIILVPLSVPELSFGPFPCFLQSESSFVTCTAQSFPDPTIVLRHDNVEVPGGDVTFDPFTGFKNYTITIGNSMEDAGGYRCVATSNGVESPIDLTTQFCRKLLIFM